MKVTFRCQTLKKFCNNLISKEKREKKHLNCQFLLHNGCAMKELNNKPTCSNFAFKYQCIYQGLQNNAHVLHGREFKVNLRLLGRKGDNLFCTKVLYQI